MAKPPRVHGRGLDTFCLATAARDVECTTLGPRKLLSICRSRLVAQLALSRLQNPALVLLFLQYASWSESLLGGGPFIVLRSRGISQIYHTYSEDMHPVYPLLLWLHTPRSNHGSGGYMGAYPPRRCGISYTCIQDEVAKVASIFHSSGYI